MKTVLLLCSIIVLVSCGKLDSELNKLAQLDKFGTEHTTSGHIFLEYIEDFKNAMYYWTGKEPSAPVIVNFGKVSGPQNIGIAVRATCYTRANFTKEVMVNEKIWYTLSKIHQQLLIDHELGHCILDRGHSWKLIISEDYESILGSIMFSNTAAILHNYTQYQDAYRQELFTGGTKLLEEIFNSE